MEAEVNRLVEKTWSNRPVKAYSKSQLTPPSQRLLIGISGIPGAGKTTLAARVTQRLNDLHSLNGTPQAPPISGFIPMDGFHLSRAQLSAMPDPKHAHDRRGAEFTFDGEAFLALLQRVREPLTSSTKTIYAPSFDHAVKDPKADDIPIEPTTRILVFEGNYLTLDKEPWSKAAALMDELWFVEVDFETAKKRLVPRHVKAGIAKDEVQAEKRVMENDLVNGKEIMDNRLEVHELVVSKYDARLVA